MEHKIQNFIIDDKQFQFNNNDPIFQLDGPNQDSTAEQNPHCNCCEESYKNYKEAKYW